MKRFAQTLLIVFALACALSTPAMAISPVSIKPDAMVNTEKVRLSDLFTNIAHAQDAEIAVAPKPGEKMVFGGDVLTLLARRFDLYWIPSQANPSVTVTRASQQVSQRELIEVLELELASRGYGSNIDIELDRRNVQIHTALEHMPLVRIDNLSIDPASNRFVAAVMVDTAPGKSQKLTLAGRLFEVIELPVLARRITAGERIRAEDIVMIKRRKNEISNNIVTDAGRLEGKTPRRTLGANELVREDAIENPKIVNRGKSVVIIFENESMNLTVRGRALEDGAMGNYIRVLNTASNKHLDAEVVGPDRVRVYGPARLAGNF